MCRLNDLLICLMFNFILGGAAALCSPDGRHLAMMPHPERCVMTWQWPWMPEEWKTEVKTSPWLKMFRNAYDWCVKQNSA